MAKRTTRAIIIIPFIALALVAGTPLMVGAGVAGALNQQLGQAVYQTSQGLVQLESVNLDRGWFGSKATLRLAGPAPFLSDPITIPLDLSHGPLLLTPTGLQVGLLFGRGTLKSGIVDDHTNLQVTVGMDDSIEVSLDIPNAHIPLEDGWLDSGTARARLSGSRNSKISVQLVADSLALSNASGVTEITIQHLDYTGDLTPYSGYYIPANSNLQIEGLDTSALGISGISQLSSLGTVQEIPEDRLSIAQSLLLEGTTPEGLPQSIELQLTFGSLSGEMARRYLELSLDNRSEAGQATGAEWFSGLEQFALLGLQNATDLEGNFLASSGNVRHSVAWELDWQGIETAGNLASLDMRKVIAALTLRIDAEFEAESISSGFFSSLVETYAEQGYLERTANSFELHLTLSDSVFTINGDTIPAAEMLGYEL